MLLCLSRDVMLCLGRARGARHQKSRPGAGLGHDALRGPHDGGTDAVEGLAPAHQRSAGTIIAGILILATPASCPSATSVARSCPLPAASSVQPGSALRPAFMNFRYWVDSAGWPEQLPSCPGGESIKCPEFNFHSNVQQATKELPNLSCSGSLIACPGGRPLIGRFMQFYSHWLKVDSGVVNSQEPLLPAPKGRPSIARGDNPWNP